jgi:hypothetical protein
MKNFLKSRGDVALHFVLHAYTGIRKSMQDVMTKGYVPVVLWGGGGSNYGRRWLSEMGSYATL